jgi:hypothetical protein
MSSAYYLLGFFVLPLWIAAGFTDYLCHRAARISENAGTPESLLHLIQYALVGLPVTLALFLKANAGFFMFAAVMILLHHFVAYIDVRYADKIRKVKPFEQMVHSFLELLPITAVLLLAVVAWPQFVALFGLGTEPASFMPQPQLLFPAYTMAILLTALLFNLVPYIEELARCLRAKHNKR